VRRRVVVATALLILIPTAALAAGTLRGQILRYDGTPAVGAVVELKHPTAGSSGIVDVDKSGMFYFHEVPPAMYTMQVRYAKRTQYFRVTVLPQPNTDIRPIKLRR
jgi:hypothetical protein